jgi:hypothetical protein
MQLIVRTGDVLNGKTIISLSFLPPNNQLGSQSRNFVPTSGDFVFLATFSDRSTPICNVVFP